MQYSFNYNVQKAIVTQSQR